MDHSIPLNEFYEGQEIFITGATGLIGKSVVEKLLRSFSNISKIFILLREKRGKNLNERLEQYKSSAIFDLVRKANSNLLQKIIAIKGDISEMGLGISDDDLKLLENVSIVYHIAATVRFDEPIKKAIFQNVRGTLQTLQIAENFKNLKIFAHVSTAYSNPYESCVKEEIYPPCADWMLFIKAAERFDDIALNSLWGKIAVKFPNTYTFSKHLAEYVVNSYKGRLPVLVYRPTIVGSAYKEPFDGWYDSFTGASGLLAAAATGIARVVYCKPDNVIDLIPLDVTSLFLIAASWKETTYPPLGSDENVRVYTVAATKYRCETLECLLNTSLKQFEETPLQKCIWKPRITCVESYFLFILNVYIFHLLPALVLDGIIKLTGNRPFLLHVQRKYIATLKVLSFFIHNEYKFENPKCHELLEQLKKWDYYPFDEMFNTTTPNLMKVGVQGMRKFMFKESFDNLRIAKIQFQVLKYLDITVRMFFFYWIAKVTFRIMKQYLVQF